MLVKLIRSTVLGKIDSQHLGALPPLDDDVGRPLGTTNQSFGLSAHRVAFAHVVRRLLQLPAVRYTNLCQCRVERGARGCAGCPEHRRCPQARASKRAGRYSFAHCRRHPQNESTSRAWTRRPKIARTPRCNRDRAVSSLFSSVPAAHSAAPATTNPHVHAQSRHAQHQSTLT